MDAINIVEAPLLKKDRGNFAPGDTVKVHVKVVEGEKERVQVFEGVVIRKRGGGARGGFPGRRASPGVRGERPFPLRSPRVEKIAIVKHGKVRRAKLFYLRERTGKSARLKEKRVVAPTT